MSSPITLTAAASEYLALRSGQVESNTLAGEQSTTRLFVRFLNRHFSPTGDMQVRSVKPVHVEKFFYDPTVGQVGLCAASTFNIRRSRTQGFVTFLERRGYTSTNQLMENIKNRKVVKRERERLSVDVLTQILDAAKKPRDRIFLATLMNTALRQSEARGLRVGSVDLDRGLMFCILSKNKKEDFFPINSDYDQELRRWLTFYTEEVGPLAPDMYLIPSMTKPTMNGLTNDVEDMKLKPYTEFKYVRRLMQDALRPHISDMTGEGAHTFRRSVARIYYDMALLDEGSRDDALRITQTLLNHSSVTMTERYIGLERERDKRDESLKGKPFMSRLTTRDNVMQLRKVTND